MSQTSRVPPSVQPIKLMSSEFKLAGNPTPDLLGKSPNVKVGSTDVMTSCSPENGAIGRKVEELQDCAGDMDFINRDSPYGEKNISPESRHSTGDEEVDPIPLPISSISKSFWESRWSDTTLYASNTKLQSWFQLPNGNWELGKIISTSGTESVISLPDWKVLKVQGENLVPANPDILDGVDDLMQLSYLNEPSVLYNLQHRYNQNMIYWRKWSWKD